MVNIAIWVGLAIETSFGLIISYVWWIGIGLGTRPLACAHFIVPAFMYFSVILFYDETRKVLLRKGFDKSVKGKIKQTGWITRNTFY